MTEYDLFWILYFMFGQIIKFKSFCDYLPIILVLWKVAFGRYYWYFGYTYLRNLKTVFIKLNVEKDEIRVIFT